MHEMISDSLTEGVGMNDGENSDERERVCDDLEAKGQPRPVASVSDARRLDLAEDWLCGQQRRCCAGGVNGTSIVLLLDLLIQAYF